MGDRHSAIWVTTCCYPTWALVVTGTGAVFPVVSYLLCQMPSPVLTFIFSYVPLWAAQKNCSRSWNDNNSSHHLLGKLLGSKCSVKHSLYNASPLFVIPFCFYSLFCFLLAQVLPKNNYHLLFHIPTVRFNFFSEKNVFSALSWEIWKI